MGHGLLRAAAVPEAEAVIPNRQLPPAPRRIAWAVLVPAAAACDLDLNWAPSPAQVAHWEAIGVGSAMAAHRAPGGRAPHLAELLDLPLDQPADRLRSGR